MINWIDTKYVGLLSSRLPRFARKNDSLWNFRCPLCGDSQKNKFKARGFLFEKTGKLFFMCHNCHASMSFNNFLKTLDHELHSQYSLETFKERSSVGVSERQKSIPNPEPDISKFQKPKFIKYTELNTLKKVSQLDPTHPAKRYVVSRRIPNYFHSRLFYTPKFKAFTNKLKPGKFENVEVDEPRLIIPLVDARGNLFGYQGRSFSSAGIRYVTIIIDDQPPKVFGLDRIDTSKTAYVVEGPIDSMFLPNCIAMVGSSLDLSTLPINKEKFVVIFDNEPRNKEIVRSVEKYIEMGYRVCIWPDHIEHKDINDMVLAGIKEQDVRLIIDNNTYQGLGAMVRFNTWKKV